MSDAVERRWPQLGFVTIEQHAAEKAELVSMLLRSDWRRHGESLHFLAGESRQELGKMALAIKWLLDNPTDVAVTDYFLTQTVVFGANLSIHLSDGETPWGFKFGHGTSPSFRTAEDVNRKPLQFLEDNPALSGILDEFLPRLTLGDGLVTAGRRIVGFVLQDVEAYRLEQYQAGIDQEFAALTSGLE